MSYTSLNGKKCIERVPEGVLENGEVKLLLDMNIQWVLLKQANLTSSQ